MGLGPRLRAKGWAGGGGCSGSMVNSCSQGLCIKDSRGPALLLKRSRKPHPEHKEARYPLEVPGGSGQSSAKTRVCKLVQCG